MCSRAGRPQKWPASTSSSPRREWVDLGVAGRAPPRPRQHQPWWRLQQLKAIEGRLPPREFDPVSPPSLVPCAMLAPLFCGAATAAARPHRGRLPSPAARRELEQRDAAAAGVPRRRCGSPLQHVYPGGEQGTRRSEAREEQRDALERRAARGRLERSGHRWGHREPDVLKSAHCRQARRGACEWATGAAAAGAPTDYSLIP